MSEVANLIKDAPNSFFLATIVDLLKGEQEQILDRVTEQSYAAHAALNLLFYPDLGQVGQAAAGEPIFVTEIRKAI